MTLEELDARLSNIERLLTVLVADDRHLPALREMQADVYADAGQRLNRLFPSDAEYPALQVEVEGFNELVQRAEELAAAR